jgi:hypothetical protein
MSYLSIYGYGPINAEVNLKGYGMSESVTSDSTGLFRFNSVYSFTYIYPELCIQAVDNENRVTQPTCIPALPNNSIIPLEVGPILLSPTLSLTDNKIVEGAESYLNGKTTPNTDVFIYLARNKNNDILSFVPTVNAYSLPVINTTSNEVGEFDINMPTSDIASYKVFASTKFGGNLSAKSNTLQFAVISSIKSFFQRLWEFLLQNKIMAFIVAEVLLLIMLFILALKPTTTRHKRHTEKDYLEYLKF